MHIFSELLNLRTVRFILVGCLNTIFSYCIYAIFLLTGLSYMVSNFLALVMGIFFSFRTQKILVFRDSSRNLFWRFVFAWIIIYFFNIFFIGKLIEAGLNEYTSGALTIVPITTLSYIFQKFFVFRKSVPN